MLKTELCNVTGLDLPWLHRMALDAKGWLVVREVSGMVLDEIDLPDGVPDQSENVPGLLLEGFGVREDDGLGKSLILTVWAAGAMHEIRTDEEAELTLRICTEEGKLPDLDVCGRCNRHIVLDPQGEPRSHVGC